MQGSRHQLYPDSAVTNYYLGEALLIKDSAGAKLVIP